MFFLGNNLNFTSYKVIFHLLNEKIKPALAKIYNNENKINSNDNIIINGVVNSIILAKNFNKWNLVGSWNIDLNSSKSTQFNSNITGRDDSGISRFYRLFNFNETSKVLEIPFQNTLLIKGKIDISIKNHIAKLNIPITIELNKNNTMILTFKDKVVNEHFGKNPIRGIIKSIMVKDKLFYSWQNKFIEFFIKPIKQKQIISSISKNNIYVKYHEQYGAYTNISNSGNINKNILIIPKYAGSKDTPSFIPTMINITRGNNLIVVNKDVMDHTVTSIGNETSENPPLGKYFDTGYIHPSGTKIILTGDLKSGRYHFGCSLHSFMKGTIIIKDP